MWRYLFLAIGIKLLGLVLRCNGPTVQNGSQSSQDLSHQFSGAHSGAQETRLRLKLQNWLVEMLLTAIYLLSLAVIVMMRETEIAEIAWRLAIVAAVLLVIVAIRRVAKWDV